jgi:Flp pilus assembly CpaE family ATPase
MINTLQPRTSSTAAVAAPNRPGPIATQGSSGVTLEPSHRNALKISVICADEQVVEDLDQILSDRNDVAIQHAFTGNPGHVELDRYLHFHSPQAILVSCGGGDHTMELVGYVRRTYPNLPVVALYTEGNLGASALLPFMRAGVREVISLPLDRQEVREVIDRLYAMPANDAIPKTGKVLCFLPSKPGVGASTVAINTAAALAREGSKVLLVDGDLTSGMVRFMLKLQNPASLREAAQRISDLDKFLWPQLITEVHEGLDVLHAGRVSPMGSLDSDVLLSLMDFWRAAYDVICFDFSGNLEQFSLEAMRYADRIFLVSTSELTSLHLLIEKAQLLKAYDMIDRVQVVQNRKTRNEDLTRRQIEKLIGMKICKVFRNSYSETLAANREGRPVRANSVLGTEFKAFAAALCGKPMTSGKSFSEALVAFAVKTRVIKTRPAVGTDRALVTFHPVLALPEPAPRALVRYKSSTSVRKT